MQIVAKCQVSSDPQFVERIAHVDPFCYWNTFIAPVTGRSTFEEDRVPMNVSVKIKDNGEWPFNYLIVYTIDLLTIHAERHIVLDALIMWYGSLKTSWEIIKK